MNIEDFKPKDYTIEKVFELQKELMFQYNPELRERIKDFDIDLYEDQELFKKYCWRITEELMEALEDISNESHFKEELIDGFNFLIDLYQIFGWDSWEIRLYTHKKVNYGDIEVESKESQILKIIYQLGITANLLKNRQWRKSQYLVDMYVFKPRFKRIWSEYMALFKFIGMTEEEVRKLWSLKYQVNLFRINTNY